MPSTPAPYDRPASVRRSETVTRYTVDVGDGVVIVMVTDTDFGYSAEAEVQYRPTGYVAHEAEREATQAVAQFRSQR